MKDNQFLAAGMWVGALGGVGSVLYVMGSHVADMGSRAVVSTLTIRNKDDAFKWVTAWVAEHGDSFVTSNRLQICVDVKDGWEQFQSEGRTLDLADAGEVLYEPGTGMHVFTYANRLVWLHREARETITSGYTGVPYTPEIITLSTFGSCSVLKSFVEECHQKAKDREGGRFPLYIPEYDQWRRVASKRARPAESLVLPGDEMAEVLQDAKGFLRSEPRYASLGVPYRRGYLFHGPPGSGKSSLVAALASELDLGVSCLSLSSRGMDDTRLASLLRESPPSSLLLLEDVDCVFRQRNAEGQGQDNYVTFSGLLNAVDGVASQEGRILVMTTNHIENLDRALLRPGRCDYKLKLDAATPSQAQRMFSRFYPNEEVNAQRFASCAANGTLSMASIQCHLLHETSPESAVTAAMQEARDNSNAPHHTPDTLPLSTAQLLRQVGLPHLYWKFYEKGVVWASQIRPFLEEDPSFVDKSIQTVLDRDEGDLVTEAQVRASVGSCGWQQDDAVLNRLVRTAAGQVTFEVFHRFLIVQTSLEAAVAAVHALVEDPTPLPPASWKGAPNWEICSAVASAHQIERERCAALLSGTTDLSVASMVQAMQA